MLPYTRYEYEVSKARQEVSPQKLEARRMQKQAEVEPSKAGVGIRRIHLSLGKRFKQANLRERLSLSWLVGQ